MTTYNIKIKIKVGLVFTLILATCSASADPGLSSLKGLGYLYLAAFVVLIVFSVLLGYLIRYAYRLARSKKVTDKWLGIALFTIIGLAILAAAEPFIDFNFYLLVDNEYPEATTITRSHVEHYFEVDDGRIFYLAGESLRYFKPGRTVVIREDKASATGMRVYDIFEASGRQMFFQQRRRTEGKKLWIPIVPVKKGRYQLTDPGTVIWLKSDWHIDDLVAHAKYIPWCCDLTWTRLLLEHGADPNQSIHGALPLSRAFGPFGWTNDEKELKNIELVLEELLSAGVDVNTYNPQGYTALFNARHSRPLKWLLQHGANPNLHSHKGETPADVLRREEERFGQYWSDEQISKNRNLINLLGNAGEGIPITQH